MLLHISFTFSLPIKVILYIINLTGKSKKKNLKSCQMTLNSFPQTESMPGPVAHLIIHNNPALAKLKRGLSVTRRAPVPL